MWEMENLEGSEEREGTWNNTGEKLKESKGQGTRKSLPISLNLWSFTVGYSWVICS